MRKLTFKGFLENYLQKLSTQSGVNIRKLAAEASAENPRLREPLVLYACVTDKLSILEKTTLQDYPQALRQPAEKVMQMLDSEVEVLPPGYHKVWKSYKSIANRQAGEDQTKQLMRRKILQLQQQKSFSNYRLYKDLHLNTGNINAWLKNDDSSKVSLDTARQVLDYAVRL